MLFYKLAMTVLIMFVSDNDANKVLFGMLMATAMMATLAFFQPFKHADILSINTGGQMAVLLVLFAAMFLLVNVGEGGASGFLSFLLVSCTLAPLVAGVILTLRLPADAHAPDSGDALVKDLSLNFGIRGVSSPSLKSIMGSFKKSPRASPKLRGKATRAAKGNEAEPAESVFTRDENPLAAAASEAREASTENPMLAREPPTPLSNGTDSARRESILDVPARPKAGRQLSKLQQNQKQRSMRSVI